MRMPLSTCRAAAVLLAAFECVQCASVNFPRASSGQGYLAVPVDAVQRQRGIQKRDGQNAFEWTLQNMEYFYAAEGKCT